MSEGRRKRRVAQHVMEDRSVALLKGVLPLNWVVREYRPDYGLDLAVEVFAEVEGEPGISEAMGEHFFVQMKSVKTFNPSRLVVRPRKNVLKAPLSDGSLKDVDETELEVLSHSIDTDLLVTVQAMGAAAVVLLVVVALDVERVFFVCLNDYIDKVLVLESPAFAKQGTVTLKIPTENELAAGGGSIGFIRFLAQRPKFYSAFSLIAYQNHELDWAATEVDYFPFVSHSIALLRRLDIWEHSSWQLCQHYKRWMDHLEKGIAALPDVPDDWFRQHPSIRLDDIDAPRHTGSVSWLAQETRQFWNGLMALGRTYEEICRERCLPTHLSQMMR